MKVQCLGAARTVTGSCFVVTTGENRFAVDCGLHQGGAETERRNWQIGPYRPGELDFILITHAHLDHTGLLPRLVAAGYRGPVYATPPTADLLKIMLLDSAHIQEMEALWKSRKRLRHGEKGVDPLYTISDAEKTLGLIKTVRYEESLNPCRGVKVTFRDAGHILGAALLDMEVEEDGITTRTIFSGDIGRPAQLIVKDPVTPGEADFLFMESTYGNRDHKSEKDSLDELAEAVSYSYSRGEKVIIPAFAVERTQEMIYCFHLLDRDGRLPKDMPVYVDSPLVIQATEIFRRWAEYFDDEAQALLKAHEDPLTLPQLRLTRTTSESIGINETPGPAVVISASGMADAGRIKHHLRHNLWREGASVVFVGFQAQGTTGRRIVEGAQRVRIFNEDVAVKARIFTINGFSAHAGQSQLIRWLGNFTSPRLQVFLVHGEHTAQLALAEKIRETYGLPVLIPDHLEELTLKKGEIPARIPAAERAAPPVNWQEVLEGLAAAVEDLRCHRAALEALPREEQLLLRERIESLMPFLSRYRA